MIKKNESFLSDRCREIIFGSLLGDGSLKIHKPYKNARFSFRHSMHQKEYFDWKVNQLNEISSRNNVWEQSADGFGGDKIRYQSLASESLTEIYRQTNRSNRLTVKRRWLNFLTPLSLMVWWLDDGSIISNGRKGVFCTDPFTLDEQKILSQYLLKVWGISVKIGKIERERDGVKKEYFRLWFRSTEELKKLLILPYMKIPSMLPKVLILYKDSQLQQRWISEVSKLTGFSIDLVEKYLQQKKEKWKHFRK
jgi:hypothetical protein